MELPRLNFPDYNFNIKPSTVGKRAFKIFDKIRLKYVSLTPEEWVRQHVLHFLTEELKYPKGLIGVEKELKLGVLSKRFDALIYSFDHQPIMLLECKAPHVPISQEVFDQAARYNLVLRVPYLLIANGHELFCCRVNNEEGSYEFLGEVPGYQQL